MWLPLPPLCHPHIWPPGPKGCWFFSAFVFGVAHYIWPPMYDPSGYLGHRGWGHKGGDIRGYFDCEQGKQAQGHIFWTFFSTKDLANFFYSRIMFHSMPYQSLLNFNSNLQNHWTVCCYVSPSFCLCRLLFTFQTSHPIYWMRSFMYWNISLTIPFPLNDYWFVSYVYYLMYCSIFDLKFGFAPYAGAPQLGVGR